MKKLERIWWIFLSIAELAIIAFWIFGFAGNPDTAAVSLLTAGISACMALSALGMSKLRHSSYHF